MSRFVVAVLAAGLSLAAEPDYRGHVLQSLPRPVAFRQKPGGLYGADFAKAAAVQTYLWQWTGRREYATAALEIVRAMTENWERGDDFFALHPFLAAYQKLDSAGMVDAVLREKIRALVDEKFRPGQRGNHNQTACRIAGVALAPRLFPDLTDAAARRQYVYDGWMDWYAIRDTIENAPNYNRVFWEMMFHFADLTNRVQLLQDPMVKLVFLRYRDQVTPGGVIPGVGDSAFTHRDSNWISVFERAATMYQEPTLRWAAQQLAQLPSPDPNAILRNVRACGELLSFCYADEWRDRNLTAKMPGSRTAVLLRATPKTKDEPDQIVLSPSRASGSPYAMIELFAQQGGHAHPDWASLQYFEIDNEPLLHGLGYNSRMTPHSNIVMLRPPGDPFPHKAMPFEANVWYEATVPLRDLERFDTIVFRVENGGQRPNNSPPMIAWVDNLRLADPAGEKLLDDFGTGAVQRWTGGTKREIDQGAKPGRSSIRVDCPGGVTFLTRKMIVPLRSPYYAYVKFSWKLSSQRSALTRPFILRLLDGSRDFSQSIVDPLLPMVVREAKAEMHGDDSYGETTLDPYFTPTTKLRHQVVMTREGVLIVRDTVTPGREADGWTCGPIFHLFSKPGESRLRVTFGTPEGTESGVQEVALAEPLHPHTVFAKQTLRAESSAAFVTVLNPHAGAATITSGAEQSSVVISGKLGISIDSRGNWSVKRTATASVALGGPFWGSRICGIMEKESRRNDHRNSQTGTRMPHPRADGEWRISKHRRCSDAGAEIVPRRRAACRAPEQAKEAFGPVPSRIATP